MCSVSHVAYWYRNLVWTLSFTRVMMVVSLQKLSKNRQRQCLEFSMFFICLPGLKFLVRLCTDLGLKDAQEYANKLKKAEKAKELREQVNMLGFFFM